MNQELLTTYIIIDLIYMKIKYVVFSLSKFAAPQLCISELFFYISHLYLSRKK